MVEYSVHPNSRPRFYYGIAAASVLAASVVGSVLRLVNYQVAAPSAFGIFGALLWAFDRYLWRVPVVCRIVGIPYIGGDWQGTLVRINELGAAETEHHVVQCKIIQTWSRIDLLFQGHQSRSSVQVIGLFVDIPEQVVIRYIYSVRPTTMLPPTNVSGEGVAELRLHRNSNGRSLAGIYYSDKLRRGDISLQYVGDSAEGIDSTATAAQL